MRVYTMVTIELCKRKKTIGKQSLMWTACMYKVRYFLSISMYTLPKDQKYMGWFVLM